MGFLTIFYKYIIQQYFTVTAPHSVFSQHLKQIKYQMLVVVHLQSKAATILRLLGNETIQFNTRGKKSEPDLRKQLNVEVKSTTKFNFFL